MDLTLCVAAGLYRSVRKASELKSFVLSAQQTEEMRRIARAVGMDLTLQPNSTILMVHEHLAIQLASYVESLHDQLLGIQALIVQCQQEAANASAAEAAKAAQRALPAPFMRMDSTGEMVPPPPPLPPGEQEQADRHAAAAAASSSASPPSLVGASLTRLIAAAERLDRSLVTCRDLIFSNLLLHSGPWWSTKNLVWLGKKFAARKAGAEEYRTAQQNVTVAMQSVQTALHEFGLAQSATQAEEARKAVAQQAAAMERMQLAIVQGGTGELAAYRQMLQDGPPADRVSGAELIEYRQAAGQVISELDRISQQLQQLLGHADTQTRMLIHLQTAMDEMQHTFRSEVGRLRMEKQNSIRGQQLLQLPAPVPTHPRLMAGSHSDAGDLLLLPASPRSTSSSVPLPAHTPQLEFSHSWNYGRLRFVRADEILDKRRVGGLLSGFSQVYKVRIRAEAAGGTHEQLACLKQVNRAALISKYETEQAELRRRERKRAQRAGGVAGASTSASVVHSSTALNPSLFDDPSSSSPTAAAEAARQQREQQIVLSSIRAEAKALAAWSLFPNSVPLLALCLEEDSFGLLFPWCEYGSLQPRLWVQDSIDGFCSPVDSLRLPVRFNARCIQDLTDALAFCHSVGMVHRDVKSDNLLIWEREPEAAQAERERAPTSPASASSSSSALSPPLSPCPLPPSSDLCFRLIDFGNASFSTVGDGMFSGTAQQFSTGFTHRWAPPEVLLDGHACTLWIAHCAEKEKLVPSSYCTPLSAAAAPPSDAVDSFASPAVDVWSWACVVCELLFRIPPYVSCCTSSEVLAAMNTRVMPYSLRPLTHMPKLHRLLYHALHVDPARRPSMQEVQQRWMPEVQAELTQADHLSQQQDWAADDLRFLASSDQARASIVAASSMASSSSPSHAAAAQRDWGEEWESFLPDHKAPTESDAAAYSSAQWYPHLPFDPTFPSPLDALMRARTDSSAEEQSRASWKSGPLMFSDKEFDCNVAASFRGVVQKRKPKGKELQTRYAVLFRNRLLIFKEESHYTKWAARHKLWYSWLLRWADAVRYDRKHNLDKDQRTSKAVAAAQPHAGVFEAASKPTTVFPLCVAAAVLSTAGGYYYFAVQTCHPPGRRKSMANLIKPAPERKFWPDRASMSRWYPKLVSRLTQLRVTNADDAVHWVDAIRFSIQLMKSDPLEAAMFDAYEKTCKSQPANSIRSREDGDLGVEEEFPSWTKFNPSSLTGDPALPPPAVVLTIGLPGAGKSTLFHMARETFIGESSKHMLHKMKAIMQLNMTVAARAIMDARTKQRTLSSDQAHAYHKLTQLPLINPAKPPKGLYWDGNAGYLDPTSAVHFNELWKEQPWAANTLKMATEEKNWTRKEGRREAGEPEAAAAAAAASAAASSIPVSPLSLFQSPSVADGVSNSSAFFFDKLNRQLSRHITPHLLSSNYVMQRADILHLRQPTTGCPKLSVELNSQPMMLLDTGGHVSEKSAMLEKFRSDKVAVSGLMYLVSLPDCMFSPGHLELAIDDLNEVAHLYPEAVISICLNKCDTMETAMHEYEFVGEARWALHANATLIDCGKWVFRRFLSSLTHLSVPGQVSGCLLTCVLPSSAEDALSLMFTHLSRLSLFKSGLDVKCSPEEARQSAEFYTHGVAQCLLCLPSTQDSWSKLHRDLERTAGLQWECVRSVDAFKAKLCDDSKYSTLVQSEPTRCRFLLEPKSHLSPTADNNKAWIQAVEMLDHFPGFVSLDVDLQIAVLVKPEYAEAARRAPIVRSLAEKKRMVRIMSTEEEVRRWIEHRP